MSIIFKPFLITDSIIFWVFVGVILAIIIATIVLIKKVVGGNKDV